MRFEIAKIILQDEHVRINLTGDEKTIIFIKKQIDAIMKAILDTE